jgi:HlyD family secretion protein
MRIGRWAAGAALAAGLAAAAWWVHDRAREPEPSYRTARLERGALQAAVSATGTVAPVRQVQVGSQVSGQIQELLVDFNSEVRQGQLIARLDPETFEYRVRQGRADVEAARASVLTAQANAQSALAQVARAQVELAEAQRDERRKRDLLAQNFISPAELDAALAKTQLAAEALRVAQAQLEVARAQVQSAQAIVRQRDAQLAQARVDLERTQIRSPVDGIVIKRSVEVGQTVAASLQAPELFVIARNLSDMQVEAAIDEADISRVRDGQPVSFTIDAFPGRNFDGSVRQVRKAAVSAQNVVSYTVVVGFSNPGSLLLPGMTANVRIVTDTRDDVLKVPNAALRVRIAGVEPEAAASATSARTGAAGRFDWLPSAQAQAAAGPTGVAAAADPGSRALADLGGRAGGPPAAASAPAPGAAPAAAAAIPAPPELPASGPLRTMRDRLVQELRFSPAQAAKVDAIIAGQLPRFAELRNLPENQRAKARDRILADMRALISQQLGPEQLARYQKLLAEMAGRQVTRGRIYLLENDGKPRAVAVRLGISDGVMTELIVPPNSPEAAWLVPGAVVITAVVTPAAAGPAAARPSALPPGPRMP